MAEVRLRPAARTKTQEEVMHHAGRALRNYPDLDVVRFIIPRPLSARPWDVPDAEAVASPTLTDVCTVSRERGFVWVTPNQRVRLIARFHDGRNDDTFFGDENGWLWAVEP